MTRHLLVQCSKARDREQIADHSLICNTHKCWSFQCFSFSLTPNSPTDPCVAQTPTFGTERFWGVMIAVAALAFLIQKMKITTWQYEPRTLTCEWSDPREDRQSKRLLMLLRTTNQAKHKHAHFVKSQYYLWASKRVTELLNVRWVPHALSATTKQETVWEKKSKEATTVWLSLSLSLTVSQSHNTTGKYVVSAMLVILHVVRHVRNMMRLLFVGKREPPVSSTQW